MLNNDDWVVIIYVRFYLIHSRRALVAGLV